MEGPNLPSNLLHIELKGKLLKVEKGMTLCIIKCGYCCFAESSGSHSSALKYQTSLQVIIRNSTSLILE